MSETPIITRPLSYFGANAENAHLPAKFLADCRWVYVPFVGGGCELLHFAPGVQILASDLNRNAITLFQVIATDWKKDALAHRLSRRLFHPDDLEAAREVLKLSAIVEMSAGSLFLEAVDTRSQSFRVEYSDVDIATAYFVVAWMGRSGVVGTRGETNVKLALRYDAGGGDPVKRFESAVKSLDAWHKGFKRCSFTVENAFEVLARLRKSATPEKRIGCYMDPPWPEDGDGYLYAFTERQQRDLAKEAESMPHVKFCVRFGDHPLIRELYPQSKWVWNFTTGRDQDNKGKDEVFLTRRE